MRLVFRRRAPVTEFFLTISPTWKNIFSSAPSLFIRWLVSGRRLCLQLVQVTGVRTGLDGGGRLWSGMLTGSLVAFNDDSGPISASVVSQVLMRTLSLEQIGAWNVHRKSPLTATCREWHLTSMRTTFLPPFGRFPIGKKSHRCRLNSQPWAMGHYRRLRGSAVRACAASSED
jgi:hypothetical protein